MQFDLVHLSLAAGVVFLLVCLILVMSKAQKAQRKAAEDLGQLRDQGARTEAELKEKNARNESVAARVPGLEEEQARLRGSLEAASRSLSGTQQELRSLKESHEARLEEIRNLRIQLEDRFKSLAGSVLNENSERFLSLVSERFTKHKAAADDDLQKRQHAISELVKPLDEKLSKFDSRMGEIEKARSEAYGAIRTQVMELARGQQELGGETRKLVQALRSPKTRGRWGEMQLKQVFEMAGMAEYVDYTLEHVVDGEAGRQRPDAVVSIPGGKQIVVDAKTPLEGYLDALESETPEMQQANLKRHAAQVRTHVKLLASKDYQSALSETPDFVVMFIPGETFVSAANEIDPDLLEYAFRNKVLIATPTTLMALVKAIAYGWQQEKMAENAAEVQKLGKEIYDRLSVFAGHMTSVGKALTKSMDSYNKAVGSLEGRVLVSARRFETLGVTPPGSSLDSLEGITTEPRKLVASELTDNEE